MPDNQQTNLIEIRKDKKMMNEKNDEKMNSQSMD